MSAVSIILSEKQPSFKMANPDKKKPKNIQEFEYFWLFSPFAILKLGCFLPRIMETADDVLCSILL